MTRVEFLYFVAAYIEQDPDSAAHVADAVQRGCKMRITNRSHFEHLVSLLPPGVSWGDPITPDLVDNIENKALANTSDLVSELSITAQYCHDKNLRFAHALVNTLGGRKSHDIRAMTGLPELYCDAIISVRDEAAELLRNQ